MPTQPEAPIGPIPAGSDPEEYDKLRRRVLWTMPYGLYVLGSRSGDRRNGMTTNLVTQVSTAPKLIGVAVVKDALTHELISSGGAFVLNLIDREDRAIVRKFVKPVDDSGGTLNGFPYRDGLTGAPVLTGSVAFVECALRETIDCGDHSFFIGEVVNADFLKAEDSPVLRMEDTRMNYGG